MTYLFRLTSFSHRISFFQVTLIFWTFDHVLKHIWNTRFHGNTKLVLNDDVSIINDVIHHVTGTQLHVLDWTNGILVKFYKFFSQPHYVSILFWVPMWPIINHNLLILNWYLPKSASGQIDSWDADLSYFFGGIMGRGTGEIAKQWILSNLKFTGNLVFIWPIMIIQNCNRNDIFEFDVVSKIVLEFKSVNL